MFRNGAKVGFFNLLENLTITFFQKQIFSFFKKIQLCHSQLRMGFWHQAKIYKDLMIQFQKTPGQTNGGIYGWIDWTERSHLVGPCWLSPWGWIDPIL